MNYFKAALIASTKLLGNPDRSTLVSPAMILDKILPNSRKSAGRLKSAAIFCADLKYCSASGRFSRADCIFYWKILINKADDIPTMFFSKHNRMLFGWEHLAFLTFSPMVYPYRKCAISHCPTHKWFTFRPSFDKPNSRIKISGVCTNHHIYGYIRRPTRRFRSVKFKKGLYPFLNFTEQVRTE